MKYINQVIKEYLVKRDVKAAQLARLCNTTQPNMSKKLSQNDMELSWVIRISEALNHNFLFDMAKEIGVKFESGATNVSIDEMIDRRIEKYLKKK